MLELAEKIEAARAAIDARWDGTPEVGIILGTGLGGFAEEITQDASIPYAEIPHFPESTVESHAGRLICGTLAGRPTMAMEGRFHFYEGYSMKDITFPVRLMRAMGCSTLVVSAACGGMNPQFKLGDLMLIEDHINLMGDNPLIGINDDRLGPRFPDMSAPYDPTLLGLAERVALSSGIRAHTGVYVAVAGPNLETRAEYRMLRQMGAAVVGMSTVPEEIAARHGGMRVMGLAIVTDMCLPDALEEADVVNIIRVAGEAEPKLRAVVRGVLAELPELPA